MKSSSLLTDGALAEWEASLKQQVSFLYSSRAFPRGVLSLAPGSLAPWLPRFFYHRLEKNLDRCINWVSAEVSGWRGWQRCCFRG